MNFIFDFDGTICDSISASVEVFNDIISKLGYPKSSLQEVKQLGLKGIIKLHNIKNDDVNKFVAEYKEIMSDKYANLYPVDDISSVIASLKQKHLLGILTTNNVSTVKKFLEENEIDYFKFIRSEENAFDKDKGLLKIFGDFKISASDTYFIGDETRDVEAANKVGAKAIAVTWGAESENLLRKSSPFRILKKTSDLLEL